MENANPFFVYECTFAEEVKIIKAKSHENNY